jgi:hypothetical protein
MNNAPQIWREVRKASHQTLEDLGRRWTSGGTNWRVTGPDSEGEELTIGVEAYQDHLGRRALLITVI